MDVELIQKINNLALDLMKQGLAQDREDAVEQAEKIFRSKNNQGYAELRENITAVEAKKQENAETASSVELSQNQIKVILEQNTQFLVKTIREFKDKIQVLEKEVSDLRTKVAYNKLPTSNDIVSAKKMEEASETSKKQSAAPINHPRVGKFQESDVSIEKVFYMGNK
ncbi:hypothetical protein J4479_02610 [Candidatus Woesearchaeota archaeon]|uniref:Uncharacterized protein n=1 Tax=Candidatus Gottesmanbacteria bacterium GW2011_GWA2_43_14 TaxID=1618443 RepID=A0A0G1DBZ0_9BACT|nr:MAG: hypothetical protein UV73_C0021G0003 [Candidatus Gottesmanbacteria bacterium GW2011_GWA2_43_14]MBS3139872.1 hypothetical protein [Candidatus Woesearchaeota archaeon]